MAGRARATGPRVLAGYRDHMSRAPGVDPDLIAAGYAEWAGQHASGPGSVLLLSTPTAHGFAAVAPSRGDADTLVIDLAGLVPAARGRGEHSSLRDGVEAHALRSGRTRISISTQADDLAAQRTWVRRGWLPERADWMVHLRRRR